MRKIYSFMVAAVAMIATAACTQEIENVAPETNGETVVYTASVDGADTKATLNETTKKSEWVANDAITVLDGTKGWTFTTTGSGANADFSNSEGFGEYRPVLAVYPKGDYTSYSIQDKKVKANIPTYQQAKVNTYNPSAALAVAYTETNSFAFKNAHALLQFTVNTDNVTHVLFHGNGSEAFTGDVDVVLGEEGVKAVTCLKTPFTEGEETVNKFGTWVECYAWDDNELVGDTSDDTKYFTKNQTYYIAVAPQVFNGGVTVKFKINDGDELVVKTTDKKVETKINTILNLGVLEYTAPATVETVYLKPNADWAQADAWFAAHFFNPVGGTVDVKMTDENEDGIYETAVPEGVDQVIFCRMNPEYTEFGWDVKDGETEVENHVWNQTASLNIPLEGDSKVYYNVTGWETGEWMTYEDATAEPEEPEIPSVTPGKDSEWALVGAFSSWADKTMLTTEDANVVVLENVEMKAAEGFLVRKPSTDWADKYGAGDINYLKANHYITTNQGGANMCLEADGTYDIYFNISTKDIYVMTAGTDYTGATKQTVSGEEPKQEEPEVTEKVVYLKPNSNWTQSNARFAAYFWNNSGDTWVSMTAVGDGTYKVHLPEGYDYGCNIIFCRMNPSTTTNNWNNKWNQTGNLTTPTDGKNLYTVKAGTWDNGGGTWSVK